MPEAVNPAAGDPSVRGLNFTYVLPKGWSVVDEGPYALALRAPDMSAGINVIGQSGLLQSMAPDAYAHAVLTGMMGSPDARLTSIRRIHPAPGFTDAALMDTQYVAMMPGGPAWLAGTVAANVAVGYGVFGGVVTVAAALRDLWPRYASWLPAVAFQAVNTGPNPYGSTTMAQAIHGVGVRDGERAAAYRAWSQALWDDVGRYRADVAGRQIDALGPMLTGQKWEADPYGNAPVRRSATTAAVWVSRDGRELQSDDPSFDPRTPYDSDWRRVR